VRSDVWLLRRRHAVVRFKDALEALGVGGSLPLQESRHEGAHEHEQTRELRLVAERSARSSGS
jgi:hypothetical protein